MVGTDRQAGWGAGGPRPPLGRWRRGRGIGRGVTVRVGSGVGPGAEGEGHVGERRPACFSGALRRLGRYGPAQRGLVSRFPPPPPVFRRKHGGWAGRRLRLWRGPAASSAWRGGGSEARALPEFSATEAAGWRWGVGAPRAVDGGVSAGVSRPVSRYWAGEGGPWVALALGPVGPPLRPEACFRCRPYPPAST